MQQQSNIEILKTGIDVSKILAQLNEHTRDWDQQRKMEHSDSLLNHGVPDVEASVLQLIIGACADDEFVGDTELCYPTEAWYNHTEIIKFLETNGFEDYSRCGFLSLPVGGSVGAHIDVGSYYQTRDRFHLAIQGEYTYRVGNEEIWVDPGTLFWFNNKLPHSAENMSNSVRITFVFDVPQDKWDKNKYVQTTENRV
jgi:mannose-6-phosphate isomerase-like protein (cupin superfamily)